MTKEGGKKVVNFWCKALEALKVAEWAYQNKHYNEAVSRSYFAVLRAALAMLTELGLKPDTKRIGYWVQANFARECVHRREKCLLIVHEYSLSCGIYERGQNTLMK